ncbi:MAG: LuxR family transcriptional regulator [Proteobacteria bacterium]|nr:LuxR family transcriptional regulator [Pseudomonadota bacterium]
MSKAELASLLEIISDCVYCTSIEELYNIANKVGGLLQSGNIVFLSSRLDFPSEPRAIEEINISYPPEWADIYRSQNFVQVDPIISTGRSGLLYWKDVYRQSPPGQEFYAQAKSFGLSNGFSHIHADKNLFGLMSIADEKLRNSERNRIILNAIAPHFHQLIAKLVHQKACQRVPKLTPREREVLLWAMEGKSNWEISVILGISQESIKGHIANILNKLKATNRAHAVAIALQYDLLLSLN